MELDGQVALVTGAASGIGRAVAETFAQNGAMGVIIADINAKMGENVAKEISQKTGCNAQFIYSDVADQDSVDAMVAATIDRFDRIDILVNNAAICPIVGWEQSTVEDWNRIISVNLTGMYLCTRAVIPHMQKRRYGRIIFVSSTAAFEGSFRAHVAYGVSKAGAIALMKSVAKGFAADGILANAVVPGPIETPLSDGFSPEIREAFARLTLLKRYGKPQDVADGVLFLTSSKSSYITGFTLHISGGQILV